MLEKTLESPLDNKEIKPVRPKTFITLPAAKILDMICCYNSIILTNMIMVTIKRKLSEILFLPSALFSFEKESISLTGSKTFISSHFLLVTFQWK